MQNFVFHNPTTVLFGAGMVEKIGAETRNLGHRALLVYGRRSIRESGLYDKVTGLLAGAGVEVIDHGGVTPNPLLDHVRRGIDLVRENRVDVVVAVGGGSVIDSAKAISAGSLVDHDVWLFFRGKKGVRKTLPLLTLLTLAGSGSEMNGGMVVTNEETRQKIGVGNRFLHPRVSILDPTLTFSVPPDYTAYGAVDAISHVLEFYFTTRDPSTPVQDRLMEGLVINLMESCERVLADPFDYQGRADLMWCATLALNGLTAAGLGRVDFPMHLLEHSLSGLYNVAHGAGLAVIMPAWMRWQADKLPDKFAQFAERVFGLHGPRKEVAHQGIDHLQNWFVSIHCPATLGELGIAAEAIPALAENSRAQARLWRLKKYSPELITEVLEKCC